MNIHPFNLYKMYLEIRAHFNSVKFIYGNSSLPNVKYSDFYETKNINHFMKLANVWSEELAEKIFISNFIKNPKLNIYDLISGDYENIKRNWVKRIRNIDLVFYEDIKKIYKKFNEEIDGDFNNLKKLIFNVEKKEDVVVNDLYEIDIVEIQDDTHIHEFLTKLNPETVIILNNMYLKKYQFDFLKKCVSINIKPRDKYIKLYKYSHFFNFKNLLKDQENVKIRKFYNMIGE